MISIIIPVYNAKKYISRCVESIINQKYREWELLLIDDGSSDGSGIICDEFARLDSRIRVFHKENGGPSSARNLGIEHALGEWLYFVDSDDFLDDDHLEHYALNFDSDIVFQGYKKIDEKTLHIIKVVNYPNTIAKGTENVIETLCDIFEFGFFFGPVWNKIFKKEIVTRNQIRFNENISYREDEIFTFIYCKYINSIHILHTTSYNYQITKNSLMRSYRSPKMCINVANLSYNASLELPLSDRFREIIENYYDAILSFSINSMYYPGKMLDRNLRIVYLSMARTRYKKHPSKYLEIVGRTNIYVYDLYRLVRFCFAYIKHQII